MEKDTLCKKIAQYGLAVAVALGGGSVLEANRLESPILQKSLREVTDYSQTAAYREYTPLAIPGREPGLSGVAPDGGDDGGDGGKGY